MKFGILIACIPLLGVGCTPSNSAKMTAASPPEFSAAGQSQKSPIPPPAPQKTVQKVYLSGRDFCEAYINFSGQSEPGKLLEYGRFISVPRDYNRPQLGQISIYAYTLRPFDPNKPSYLFVDGGPGQNSHGLMPEYLDGAFNEIRFDQRGLGCSAPATWQEYKDPRWYSSENTVQDMERIRRAYGINNWSIYGVSYGTVPATMYASLFSTATVSLVLEGVVGNLKLIHPLSYKAEKLNLILQKLDAAQREAFDQLMEENSEDTRWILRSALENFYNDSGLIDETHFLQQILRLDGSIDRGEIQKLKSASPSSSSQVRHPQRPGATDENILTILYCKNLGKREKPNLGLDYSPTKGFFTVEDPNVNNGKDCDQAGVSALDEDTYRISQFPTTRPVYYFQGSHDGATLAQGALAHWRTVAQGASYFLLAQKGGHNPNLTRLASPKADIRSEEQKLFSKAVSGLPITMGDLEAINQASPWDWKLSTDPRRVNFDSEKELSGIHLHSRAAVQKN